MLALTLNPLAVIFEVLELFDCIHHLRRLRLEKCFDLLSNALLSLSQEHLTLSLVLLVDHRFELRTYPLFTLGSVELEGI